MSGILNPIIAAMLDSRRGDEFIKTGIESNELTEKLTYMKCFGDRMIH